MMNRKPTLHNLDLPVPSQLFEAIGYFGDAKLLGVWHTSSKIQVSDYYFSFVTNNAGWYAYYRHQLINLTLSAAAYKFDLYEDEWRGTAPEYGYLLAKQTDKIKIYIVKLKELKQLLKNNPDPRPDWVLEATKADLKNQEWLRKYETWSASYFATFPQYSERCIRATQQMIRELNFEQN